jgi:hypothetical protein
MTKNLSRERALTATLDHLHTEATELARFASKATAPATVAIEVLPRSNASGKTRRAPSSRWRRIVAAAGALVFAGFTSATLASSAAFADTAAAPNSVLSVGAPHLGPAAGLALHAGVVGIASNPSGRGYWLVGSDGGVFAFGNAGFFGSTGNDRLNAPIAAIAPTSNGRGYWLVANDGGVFAFGNAHFHGSTAGTPLAAPIVAIVPTMDNGGYWLVAADGGVFAFGNAHFHGSAVKLQLASPIVGAAGSVAGDGYWLAGADGGVFAFGDAHYHGSDHDLRQPAVGIAAASNGRGYWIARADGSVRGHGVTVPANGQQIDASVPHPNTVGIAASARGGYWLAVGPIAPTTPSIANDPFLACTRAHESDQAGGYRAVSASGTYRGAYQFDQSTWDNAARLAGRNDLVGVDPATVAPADQDFVAISLFHARGGAPWGYRCGGLS